jgi:hypothetical protein
MEEDLDFLKKAHNLQEVGEDPSGLSVPITDKDLEEIDNRLMESDQYVDWFAKFIKAVRAGNDGEKERMRKKMIRKSREVALQYYREKEEE